MTSNWKDNCLSVPGTSLDGHHSFSPFHTGLNFLHPLKNGCITQRDAPIFCKRHSHSLLKMRRCKVSTVIVSTSGRQSHCLLPGHVDYSSKRRVLSSVYFLPSRVNCSVNVQKLLWHNKGKITENKIIYTEKERKEKISIIATVLVCVTSHKNVYVLHMYKYIRSYVSLSTYILPISWFCVFIVLIKNITWSVFLTW